MSLLLESRLKKSVAEHAEAIQTCGYTVLESLLSREHTEALANKLNQIFAAERRIGSSDKWQNPRYQISYLLPVKDKIFRQLCTLPELLQLARQVLGNDCLVDGMNGFAIHPGGEKQKLHVDLKAPGASLPTILCLFVLDDFKRENGCTRIVPFSQNPPFIDGQSYDGTNATQFDHLEEQAVYIEAPAGSVIVYNNSMLHAASTNSTANPRRCIHVQYCRSWMRPYCDMAFAMRRMRPQLTGEELQLFGFDSVRPLQYNERSADLWHSQPPLAHRMWCQARRLKSLLLGRH